MFETRPNFPVTYVPWEGVDPDDAVRLGATWLAAQPGQRLVLMAAKKAYDNNGLLPALTSGARVEAPQTAWKAGWDGGPVLAPWPSERVLACLSDELAAKISAVCVIEWGNKEFVSAWLTAHNATNLVGGPESQARTLLSPVVEAAMRDLSEVVNHNNGLVQDYEKAYAVRTLQELVRAGYGYDVNNLCAWALANGFTEWEVKQLRDYGTRALEGRSFRLRERVGPDKDAVKRWEQEAHQLQGETKDQNPLG
jgi:hypothetical protein